MGRRKSTLTMPVPDKRESWRSCRSYYVTADGRIVRQLVWESYEPCLTFGGWPRTYQMRLAPDDPRPLGRRVYCGKYWTDSAHVCRIADHDLQMEIGVWYLHDPNEAPAPGRDFRIVALIAEHAVKREEAA